MDEAFAVLAHYGIKKEDVVIRPPDTTHVASMPAIAGSYLFAPAFAVFFYGLAWGFTNWGFITFFPSMLSGLGFEVAHVAEQLALATIYCIPCVFGFAALYGYVSTRWTLGLTGFLTCGALIGLASLNDKPHDHLVSLHGLLFLLILSSSLVISMLTPYAAEIFPTALRGRGVGLVAAASKGGGVIASRAIAQILVDHAGLLRPGLVALTFIFVGAGLQMILGPETRGRTLDQVLETMQSSFVKRGGKLPQQPDTTDARSPSSV